jgi:ABC-type branched-subunit amino acid transport system ATPase component
MCGICRIRHDTHQQLGYNTEDIIAGLSAVLNFNFRLDQDELVGLIGPNGAGKTTVFNLITGIYKPDQGSILFNEQNIVGLAPHTICARGIARTFQNIRLFNDLSVLDNVKIAAHKDVQYGLISTILRTPRFFKGEELIEHDMSLVMGVCERIYVLDYGQVIAEALPAEIRNDKKVIEAYLKIIRGH